MRYAYDAANRLTSVELYTGGGYTLLSEADYNGDGERVSLTTYALGTPQMVSYVVSKVGLLVANDGSQETLYLYGQSLMAEYSSSWNYPLRDSSSGVRQTVDENGIVTSAQTYKPFGGVLQESGPYESAFGFLEAQLDRVSGLLYANGRYYDPVTGRYLTPNHDLSNPYTPLQRPDFWLLLPLIGIVVAWRGRRGSAWRMLVLVCVICFGLASTSCNGTPRPPLPPLPDTPIIDAPWIDEMDPQTWEQYPNSCGAMALYMFLKAEHQQVNLPGLVNQLAAERPGGYDGYCCSDGWGIFPPPTPAPEPWCNAACVSAETLASVAQKYYGLAIESGDGWTRERVHTKLSQGHPVLALVRVDMSTTEFGHFVVIRGLVDQGATVVFNDSYPRNDRATWDMSSEERRAIGEGRREDWYEFDASWASAVDHDLDPLAPKGHVRWAMAVR